MSRRTGTLRASGTAPARAQGKMRRASDPPILLFLLRHPEAVSATQILSVSSLKLRKLVLF